jgi:DNA-binding MarR family transcriptional regulator
MAVEYETAAHIDPMFRIDTGKLKGTTIQARLMWLIVRNNEPVTVSAIADALGMAYSNVGHTMKRLETYGLVESRPFVLTPGRGNYWTTVDADTAESDETAAWERE